MPAINCGPSSAERSHRLVDTSAAPSKGQHKDYVSAFANAISCLSAQQSQDEILAEVPGIFCECFWAVRSEVWLWDEPTSSGYLTYSAGAEAKHWRDYITRDSGPLGQAAASGAVTLNLSVAEAGKDSFDFVQRARLSHMSVFQLTAKGKVVAVSVNYGGEPATATIVSCWRAFAEIAGLALESAAK